MNNNYKFRIHLSKEDNDKVEYELKIYKKDSNNVWYHTEPNIPKNFNLHKSIILNSNNSLSIINNNNFKDICHYINNYDNDDSLIFIKKILLYLNSNFHFCNHKVELNENAKYNYFFKDLSLNSNEYSEYEILHRDSLDFNNKWCCSVCGNKNMDDIDLDFLILNLDYMDEVNVNIINNIRTSMKKKISSICINELYNGESLLLNKLHRNNINDNMIFLMRYILNGTNPTYSVNMYGHLDFRIKNEEIKILNNIDESILKVVNLDNTDYNYMVIVNNKNNKTYIIDSTYTKYNTNYSNSNFFNIIKFSSMENMLPTIYNVYGDVDLLLNDDNEYMIEFLKQRLNKCPICKNKFNNGSNMSPDVCHMCEGKINNFLREKIINNDIILLNKGKISFFKRGEENNEV